MPLTHYKPPSPHLWCGRDDGIPNQYFHQIIRCHSLLESPVTASMALLGFACDEGVRRNKGRAGSKRGPEAIRRSLAPLPLSIDLSYPLIDYGDIVCDDADLEAAQSMLSQTIGSFLQSGCFPLVLGGGHEVAWPHFLAYQRHYPNKKIGIINFDAHWDMRPLLRNNLGSSGTPFRQIFASISNEKRPFHYLCIGLQPLSNTPLLHDFANQCGAQSITAEQFQELSFAEKKLFIQSFLDKVDVLYLSIDLDVFASPYAPGVSAPQPLGLLPSSILPILRFLASHPKLAGVDFAELAPLHDRASLTAKLAALLLATIIGERNKI